MLPRESRASGDHRTTERNEAAPARDCGGYWIARCQACEGITDLILRSLWRVSKDGLLRGLACGHPSRRALTGGPQARNCKCFTAAVAREDKFRNGTLSAGRSTYHGSARHRQSHHHV